MKKEYSIYIVISIVFLVLLDLFLIISNINLSKISINYQNKLDRLVQEDSIKEKVLIENILLYSMSRDYRIKEEIELTSEKGEKTSLKNLYSDKPIIIFRYFKESCHSCIQKELQLMKEVFTENELNKIIIITSEDEAYKIKFIKEINQIKNSFFIFNSNLTKFPFKINDSPYLFVIKNKNELVDLFIPIKQYSSPSIIYYRYLKNKYFKN